MTPVELLRGSPAFGQLGPQAIGDLASALEVRGYPTGHVFIREAAHGSSVFLILDGRVEVLRERRDERLNELGSGELFGLLSLVDDEPRSATCRASSPCTVGEWNQSVVRMLYNQHAEIAHAFQMALAAQLVHDFRQLDLRVRQRLAGSR